MADKGRLPAVAGVLIIALVAACGSCVSTLPSDTRPTGPPTASAPLMLHAMSFQLASEPHYRLFFEGGEPGSFSELRLLAPDGAVIAAGAAVPRADETMQMCGTSKPTKSETLSQTPPVYGALRATLILASQVQLGDVIRYPERYRIEALTAAGWRPAAFVFNCHGQE